MRKDTEMETLKYTKVRDVKSPCRAHSTDAGIDFFVPVDIDVDTFNEKCNITGCHPGYSLDDNYKIKTINLMPGESVLIPSGIHVKIPEGHALIYFNKSGIASKKHLHVGACVVDFSYTGECNLNLTNVGNSAVTISAGEKIVQGLVIPVNLCQTEEVNSLDELYNGFKSTRGCNGFGSTNNS